MLNGSSLVYYETHKKMDEAKGDLLLTVGCEVRDASEAKHEFCFEIVTNNECLRLSCGSERERDEWKSAILDTVSLLSSTCQGFLGMETRGVFGTKTTRKFFVLHGSALTYHADHHSTYKKQGEFPLHSGSRVAVKEGGAPSSSSSVLLEVSSGEGRSLSLASKNVEEAETWRAGIQDAIDKLVSRDALASKRGKENEEKVDGRAGKGCENPNFKGAYLGRFPLLSADFWTSDHLSERSRP